MSETVPGWIVPGAHVVAFTHGSGGLRAQAKRATIERVAKQSFTVDGERYQMRNQTRNTGTWSPSWHVVPVDSDEGKEQLEAERKRRLLRVARRRAQTWMQDGSQESRLAAIKALEAVED